VKDVVHREHRQRAEHWWFRARRAIFARLLDELIALPRNARILDVGPGSGVNLPVLGPRGKVTVLDVDRGSLEHCRASGAHAVVLGDATRPPFADGVFDLVCALDVVEHLEDDRAALAACRRLLVPGGHLLLTVPALPLLWGRQDVLSGHWRRYRRRELEQRVREAGFSIRKLTYFNTLLFPPILAVRLAMRPFLRWTRSGGSDLIAPSFGFDRVLYRAFAAEGPWLVRRRLPIGVSLLCWAQVG
jgi:SAM-dependent methyltransferase